MNMSIQKIKKFQQNNFKRLGMQQIYPTLPYIENYIYIHICLPA